jgi:homoserine kinase type II
MAVLTALDLAGAQAIARRYGLVVHEVLPIPAGSVNSNFALLHSGSGLPPSIPSGEGGARVFLRIFEEQDAQSARREAALLDHLCAGGVRTPRPLVRTDGAGFISEHAGKPVAIFPWCEGQASCQAGVTPERARRVGEALARVHLAGATFEGAAESRFDVPRLRGRLVELARRSLDEPLRAVTVELGAALDRTAALPPPPQDCQGVIHADLFRDNVLWDAGGELGALLDFESASRGSFAFDLMVTVIAWCFAGPAREESPSPGNGRFEVDLARAMVAGYCAVRPPPEAERARYWAEARFAATRFTITRITDFELRPPMSGVFKDYRRFLARLRMIEALGAEGWAALLGANQSPRGALTGS